MEKLKQILAQDDTVLFIGSGISLWSGLPSWSGLIEELAKFLETSGVNADLVRAEAQRGDLLQAASYGFDKLTKHQIGDFIRKACNYGVAKPHELHRKIVSLGPRCFVTTNYDNLIEESLRLWQPDRFFRPPVTNRHLTETAGIVHSRAVDFVFKPHGDAADSESIILTREQYRQLLPGGERQAALESVKMLLASRPVVYLGFGLRDPDFIYVRDLLANTYKGGIRDHYAIMADITEAEADYWRRTYGIHLVSYHTTKRTDKSKDHNELLKLLDKLREDSSTAATPSASLITNTSCSSEIVLALARHANKLTRTPKNNPEFPIRVHSEKGYQRYAFDKFDHWPVEQFLDIGAERGLLIGLPGAGKTYSLHQAAARFAEKLHEACLAEPFYEKNIVVPILADLKLYQGDLYDLVNKTLPNGLSLKMLMQYFKVKIFLDSFNEMPREYWENSSYEADFAHFINKIGNSSLIIGSRTNDGLSKLGFPAYCLDQIDEEFVVSELKRLKINIGGRFKQEVRRLLQKPFYFQLVTKKLVKLPKNPHPKDFYQAFFNDLTYSFEQRFGQSFNLEYSLSLAAYAAINRGEEALSLAITLQILKTQLQEAAIKDIPAQDIVNWLVSKSVIIPYTNARIAFFHQSVTEYLAASELARQYQIAPYLLKEKLRLTRWDQALFLALSLLPPDKGSAFLQNIIEADFALALNATKYLEIGQDELVTKLLSEIPHRIKDYDHSFKIKIEVALAYGVPITEIHEPELRAIMKCGSSMGAAAVERLVQLRGVAVKDELLQSLVEFRHDYNYCRNGIASALAPFITSEDITKLVALADSIQEEVSQDADENVAHGLISGSAKLLSSLEIDVIKNAFLPFPESSSFSEIRAKILCEIFWGCTPSTAALNLAADLLLRGIKEATTAIYFIVSQQKSEHDISWSSFDNSHLECLISIINSDDKRSWGLKALRCLCQARPDIAEIVRSRASSTSGLFKAALLNCASPEDSKPIFEALTQLTTMSKKQRKTEPIHLLQQIDINWLGHETLLVQLLQLRDTNLALALTHSFYYDDHVLEKLDIGPIEWWLNWLLDEKDAESKAWLQYRIAWLFSKSLKHETLEAFVAEFNKPGSKFRKVLAGPILLARNDLTTDNFSEDAISFLLADLHKNRNRNYIDGHLLGNTATETFVTERLLPLLPDAKGIFLKNLHHVLRHAGARHSRRYVSG